MPLLVHGEVTDPAVDVFDREAVFIERVLQPLAARLARPARWCSNTSPPRDAVTICERARRTTSPPPSPRTTCYTTAMPCWSAAFVRIITACRYSSAKLTARRWSKPPPAAIKKFFLGTDSAPHAQHTKETACGCAGCYTAHAAIELYAEAFEQAGALDKLEGFRQFLSARIFMACRAIPRLSLCARGSGKHLRHWDLANIDWCHCVRERC